MAYQNVLNEPHIKYNPVSKLYIVTRTVKGKSQYEGGITSLTKAKQIRDKFVKALPAETTAQTNIRTKTFSGNIDPKELNKASRFFYKRGEISSPYYEDLQNLEKRKVSTNVRKGATPGKFSANTIFTPLKKFQQNKILKQFPDADFTIYKYGFSQAVDPQKFDAVGDFIERGYKPAFYNVKNLPKKTQDIIVEAFGKEADEAGTPLRFGPGRKFGVSPKENAVLNQRIGNFIRDAGKNYPYAFNFDKSENWIIAQMVRAAKTNPAVYKVLKNNAGKIIGASENGIKYYHVNSQIGNLITNHPEAKKISKFVEVARNAKANIPEALAKAFPKGFDRTLLRNDRAYTDLLQWLDNSQGRRVVKNAIEVHHAGAGGVGGNPALAKDLQLLTRQDNITANTIKNQILKNDFSRVQELKDKGIRLNVGGKEYGAGFETAEKGLKRIETQAAIQLGERLKTDPKLSGFSKFLEQDVIGSRTAVRNSLVKAAETNEGGVCQIFRAEGGRIGFAAGSNCARQMEMAFDTDPVRTTEQINKIKTVPEKVKSAGMGFLNLVKRGGKFGALAAVGAGAAAIVKPFMNDDVSTYLSDEGQQKNMLKSMILDPITQPDEKITEDEVNVFDKAYLPTLGAVTAAGAIPGGKRLFDVRKRMGAGNIRAALSPIRGVLGKGLAATGTPLGIAALEPLYLASQISEGDSLGEIATNPLNYLAPAFAGGLSREATRFVGPTASKVMRLGISPTALKTFSRRFGLPGLALSSGISGFEMLQNYRAGRGLFDDG